MDIKEVIDSFPLAQKNQLLPVRFNPGEIVIREGDEVNYGYFFLEGTFDVLKTDIQGKNYIVTKNHNGEFCCFMEIFSNNSKQCVTIKAVTTLVGYKLKKNACLSLLKDFCLFQEYLIKAWALQFYNTNINSSRYPIYSFKYKLINFLLKKENQRDQGGFITVSINRNDLAGALGSSRRTIFRLLKELKEQGMITIRKNGIQFSKEQEMYLQDLYTDWN